LKVNIGLFTSGFYITSARQRTECAVTDVSLSTDLLYLKAFEVLASPLKVHLRSILKSTKCARALRHVRKFISKDDAIQIAVKIASARLDYCNSVIYNTSQSYLNFKRAQNSLTRVVTNTHKRDDITSVLIDLHWMPISACIDYKIAVKSLV